LLPRRVDTPLKRRHHVQTISNSAKGPNIAGIDPDTGKLASLFNPRRQSWARHFDWNGPLLVGRTRSGRATITVLAINDPAFVNLREALIAAHVFPPR